jgi:steroid Delta-isomerase
MRVPIETAVQDHALLFNEAVRSGDYTDFLATFADDAVMSFADLPFGPFHGRAAIAEAYAAQPPTDTLAINSVDEIAPDTARVAVRYSSGRSGTMTVRWRDGEVADLVIVFD